MIRINLLPVREARREAALRNQAVLLGVAVGVGVLVCAGIHFSMKSRISAHQRMIAEKRSELASLEETRKQVEEFRREREEIQKKLNVIADLEAGRSGPVRLMDEIATRIPQRTWLTSLSAKEGVMAMEGRSVDAEIVAAMLTSLEESSWISDVALEETTLEESDGLKLNMFRIRSRYPYRQVAAPDASGGPHGNRRKH